LEIGISKPKGGPRFVWEWTHDIKLAEGRSLINPKRVVQNANGRTFGPRRKLDGPREPA
jgi:hypothetical protein